MRVFRLIAIKAIGEQQADGSFDADATALGVFSSIENAEAMIRIHIENAKEYAHSLGYAIYENELDDLTLHGPWRGIPEFLTVRTYFADGTLNAFCDCDDTCEKQWHGRDAETIHYKRGDFVSVWHGRRVVPMLIGELPITTARKITGDWGDDCYLAYSEGLGHDHPFTPYVFPLLGKISKRVKDRIEAERREWEDETPAPGTARHRTRKAARAKAGVWKRPAPSRPAGE